MPALVGALSLALALALALYGGIAAIVGARTGRPLTSSVALATAERSSEGFDPWKSSTRACSIGRGAARAARATFFRA